jgi:hypothetical protein
MLCTMWISRRRGGVNRARPLYACPSRVAVAEAVVKCAAGLSATIAGLPNGVAAITEARLALTYRPRRSARRIIHSGQRDGFITHEVQKAFGAAFWT